MAMPAGVADPHLGHNTTVSHEQLQTVLTEVRRQSAAQAALLLSGDGKVLESVGEARMDLDSLAAYAASSVMVCERLGESASFGAPEAVMVVFAGRAVVMAPLGPAVAVVIGSAAQMGSLRLTLARYLDDLAAALKGEFRTAPKGGRTAASPGDTPSDGTLAAVRINPGLV